MVLLHIFGWMATESIGMPTIPPRRTTGSSGKWPATMWRLLVYICAPLRGELEKNIAFAKEKAQEVFQAGDIPICPHLMFPPFADPDDPAQDQAAREMGLRLVEHCQQVNVYGTVRTPGMLAEIRRAEELNIPVKADQPRLKKKKDRPRRGQIR